MTYTTVPIYQREGVHFTTRSGLKSQCGHIVSNRKATGNQGSKVNMGWE